MICICLCFSHLLSSTCPAIRLSNVLQPPENFIVIIRLTFFTAQTMQPSSIFPKFQIQQVLRDVIFLYAVLTAPFSETLSTLSTFQFLVDVAAFGHSIVAL